MRIAVVNLTSGGLSGGYRKYLRRLMPLLAADRRVRSLSIFVPPAGMADLAGLDVRPLRLGRAGMSELVRNLDAVAPDVVFVPTARHLSIARPTVTMVRNMEPLSVPFGGNTLREGVRNLARAWEARRASRRATRVIAVSQHVREFIVARWGVNAERVGVVAHGVDPVPLERAEPASPILFTAGSIRPARGLEDVVAAMPHLGPDVHLVVAGRVDPGCGGYARRLQDLARTLGVSTRVTWAGQLGSEEMARGFAKATLFVMTSRAEACPNTVLEAMSAGVPAVSVDLPPMPEFFAGAALYYPATDSTRLAAQIRVLLGDPRQREVLGGNALRRSAAFTWEATADGTIRQLEQALS